MIQTEFYQADLAQTHDDGFGRLARAAAAHLADLLPMAPNGRGLVIELGCGSGIMAEQLTALRFDVLGVDVSPAMLEIARRRAPSARFQVGSFVDCDLPPCRAVTAISEVFNYLADPRTGWSTLVAVWQRIYSALEPGGVLLFDVATPARFADQQLTVREADDWTCIVQYAHDAETARLTRRIVNFRRLGDLYRRSEETHVQQLYQSDAVKRALADIGFEVETLDRYADAAFPAGLAGFLARRPAESQAVVR